MARTTEAAGTGVGEGDHAESLPTLTLTVGLPQSGKSTWAMQQGVPVVNPDAIRLAIHGQPFIGDAEPFVWATAKAMVKALFIAGHRRVVLDATNTTRKRRDEWKSSRWERQFEAFPCPPEVCRDRARKTCVDDDHFNGLSAAIDRMHEQFEPVGDDE